MRVTPTTTVAVELDEGEAAELLEYLVRSLRMTDDLSRCPIPEPACGLARELAAALTGDVVAGPFPPTPTEQIVTAAAEHALQVVP